MYGEGKGREWRGQLLPSLEPLREIGEREVRGEAPGSG